MTTKNELSLQAQALAELVDFYKNPISRYLPQDILEQIKPALCSAEARTQALVTQITGKMPGDVVDCSNFTHKHEQGVVESAGFGKGGLVNVTFLRKNGMVSQSWDMFTLEQIEHMPLLSRPAPSEQEAESDEPGETSSPGL